ncbi:MAG: RNA polymerase subunit sigma-70 [Planctomycetes bacterium]|nr:RNA polymerase subunit sigma-70 [Planctomycetota bacterium]
MGTITLLLHEIRIGKADASDRLFHYVYDELKQVARQHLRHRKPGTLHATALVNMAYQRLVEREALNAEDRRHFFFLLSRAMHDVLVEQVRADCTQKRGGGAVRVPLVEFAVDGDTNQIEILDLNDALAEFTKMDSEAAQVVILRYYGGLTIEEVAESTGTTLRLFVVNGNMPALAS